MAGQVSGMSRDGRVRGQVVMRDGEAGLVWERGEAGGRNGNGLHRGHCGVYNNALATVSSCDWSTRHLVVGDFHVFSRRLMTLRRQSESLRAVQCVNMYFFQRAHRSSNLPF